MKVINLLNEVWVHIPKIVRIIIVLGIVLYVLKLFGDMQHDGMPLDAR